MLGTYRRHFRQALLGCSATDCPAFNTPSPSHEPSDAAAIAFSFIQSRTPCECPHANPAESGGEPVGISLEDLERFYNEGQSTGDFGEMCSMVTDAFGKSLKLASSFLDSPANVTAAFLAATLEQLTLLKAHDITSDSSKLLSLLIILLQNPLLLDPMSHAELLPTMCEVLSKLPQFHHPILCQELLTPPTSQPGAADATAAENREYMARELERLIGIFQHFITLRLLSRTDDSMTPNRDVAVMNATKCLSMFYQANERYHLIPYTEFYNDAVNEQLDIKEDFPHFKDRKGFTFCDYSFILNPAIKADILKVESMFQMRHELQDAFFRALFQGTELVVIEPLLLSCFLMLLHCWVDGNQLVTCRTNSSILAARGKLRLEQASTAPIWYWRSAATSSSGMRYIRSQEAAPRAVRRRRGRRRGRSAEGVLPACHTRDV
ncbi:hypothetical protein BC938DRAFT_483803 [Jimgerdemannia flammicorona]|uniref:Uncharacterized protein n=1 Tax=Jimgerdemannia flammicorona TaxID=994334 RepID=A0A433R055_9FUNG|nr:hypothetical protein BC938DRAFT_483803 [Jimgerdemannia flammicorona]